jgi:DNA polymerase delta subunit 1
MRVLSFDIECYSPSDNVFPRASSCPVIAIGNSIYEFNPCGGSKFIESSCFSFNPVLPVPELNNCYLSELLMLERWRDYFVNADIDVVIGYNIWKFDIPYLLERISVLNQNSIFLRLGRIISSSIERPPCDAEQTLFAATGISEIDVYVLAKKRKGLSSFKLGDVAAAEINMGKLDLPHTEINCCFRSVDVERIAKYCIRDTELPLLLMDHWGAFDEMLAVSRATFTHFSALAAAGKFYIHF